MKQFIIGLSLIILITGCTNKNDTTVVTVGQNDGLLRSDGVTVVKPIYKKINKLGNYCSCSYEHPNYINFHWLHINDEKFAVVKNTDNKYGIINEKGELKLKPIFDSIGGFFNGFAKIEVNKKIGLINKDFEIVLKPIYDGIRANGAGSFIVKNFTKNQKTKYGCLNSELLLIAPLDYDMIYLPNDNRMRVQKDGLWGIMATDCTTVSKPKYDYITKYSNSFAKVKKEKLWTYIDLDGKEIEDKIFNTGIDF